MADPKAASGKWQGFTPTKLFGWFVVLAFLVVLAGVALTRTDGELWAKLERVWAHIQDHGLDIDGEPPTTVLPTTTVP